MEVDDTSQIRILLVDDDEEDAFITKKIFSQIPHAPYLVDWIDTFEAAKQAIQANEYDAYIIDYRLGEFTGHDLLYFAEPQKRHEPFILLTGAGDEDVEVRSMELAASDYLVKGSFNADLLSRTIRYALQRKSIEKQRIEQLIELNRSKDEFISLASHQLRTPATGVKQYIGMVLEGFVGEVDDKQRDILTKAYDSNERQLKIVSDLLKVAQVDAGKVVLKKIAFNLTELLEDVIDEQKDTYLARTQTITHATRGQKISIEADQSAVRMVLENLIDNASKYSAEGGNTTVTAEIKDDEVRIVVADEGVGIRKKDVPRLFEKFSRLDNPLSTKVGGTGLGLYWAKKVIDIHDGRLMFEPNHPKGSRFIVCLPV